MYSFDDIIGNSEEINNIKDMAKKISNFSSPVLIYGDTGTGKELIVQAIHNYSERRKAPFIAQNCAAIPNNLLESIFFGVGRGGYTGAVDSKGLFEIAEKGTLYLDELNSMDVEFQGKLLRVIQEGEYRRVGEVVLRKNHSRIIASVNENPEKLLEERNLRKDLYYRLNVIRINMPDLDSRREDIPLLIENFIDKYNKKLGTNVRGIEEAAVKALIVKDYKGNIRELEHIIEQAMNYTSVGIIRLKDLSLGSSNSEHNMSLKYRMEKIEKKYIKESLIISKYNITKASELLRIPRQTLQYKIKKYNINIK